MDPRKSSSQPFTAAVTEGGAVGRAPELLAVAHVSLHELLLDPGDELSVATHTPTTVEASFLRAFVPLRSYQRLVATGLDGLMSLIARNPATLAGRILVRALDGDGSENGKDSRPYVVIDGSRHVAALRRLAETRSTSGADLPDQVVALFHECPVLVVHPEANPAFVLALLSDAVDPGAGDWSHGQRDRLLHVLAENGVHHSQPTVAAATAGSSHTLRRYQAYLALQQMMQQQHVTVGMAVSLYPLFHEAVGRPVIRSWLDWDDALCRFIDDTELDHFYRLLSPKEAGDGAIESAHITSVEHVVQLCDVLGEPEARRAVLEHGVPLDVAMEMINAEASQQVSIHIGKAFESMRWDRRRFRPRS